MGADDPVIDAEPGIHQDLLVDGGWPGNVGDGALRQRDKVLQRLVEPVTLLVAAEPVEAGPGDLGPVGHGGPGGQVDQCVPDEVAAYDVRAEQHAGGGVGRTTVQCPSRTIPGRIADVRRPGRHDQRPPVGSVRVTIQEVHDHLTKVLGLNVSYSTVRSYVRARRTH